MGLLLVILQGCRLPGGTADLRGTAPGSKISGRATFTETAKGLEVSVHVAGVPPGLHAIHIHETGNCENLGNAAGGHFNPHKVKHGFLPKDGPHGAHVGDMGNLDVGADGRASLALLMPSLTLRQGPHAVAGRALILHEKPDDFGQPTGNAGGRIACGVIIAPEASR
jgi:Cu-Zn family superoxide dismutase